MSNNTSRFTKSLSIFCAEQFVESVSEPASSNLYLSIGKVEAWANDSLPPTSDDSVGEKYSVWKNMWFAKKITGNDMCLVAPRVNWTANTVYMPYTETANNLFGNSFYVMTSAFNVYKCLGNGLGANSTIEPSFTKVDITTRTSDGYLWKYLYTVRRSDRIRFMTDDWMPVRYLTNDDATTQWDVQESAIQGAISAINVGNAGSNLWPNVSVNVAITGDGTFATANAVKDAATNTLAYIIVTNEGQDYTRAEIVVTANGESTDVVANAVIGPFGGHGYNAVEELGASTVMINIRLRGDENSRVQVGNDFRQVAIIRDPLVRATGNLASNTIVSQITEIGLAGFGAPYLNDEWVYQGASLSTATFRGKVVYFSPTDNIVQLANVEGDAIATSLIGQDSAAIRFVTEVTQSELVPYSGQVLYIDNIVPISRAMVQTDDIKIPISF
jgi:hypothetical protein